MPDKTFVDSISPHKNRNQYTKQVVVTTKQKRECCVRDRTQHSQLTAYIPIEALNVRMDIVACVVELIDEAILSK